LFEIFFNLFVLEDTVAKKQFFKGREEPAVLYCEEENHLAPGASFGPVIRDIFIVECCREGYGSVVINGKEFPVTPGSCYILLPGDSVVHKADTKNPRKGIWCSIDGLAVGRYLAMAGISAENPFAPPERFSALCGWIEKMIDIFRQDSAGSRLLLTSCVYGFLGELLGDKSAHGSGEEWVDRALGLMESRYHEPLSVSAIADQIGLERAYFSTLFKEKTGLSPHRYLTELRIRKACGLLKNSECTVAQAASSVGLDSRNFARLFKTVTGKTPLAYQKERG
jgi:AraC-like DNA-binding protein